MSQSPSIRILVAEDHILVRDGLVSILNLQADMTVVAEATNGEQAVDLYRHHQPDVTLMDLQMPKLAGADAIAQIRTEFPNARMIVLTTYDGDADIYRGLRAGARGYLLKDATSQEFLTAIRAVHQGQRQIAPRVALKLAERVEGPDDLTERELSVLRLLMQGNSNQEIGTTLKISEGTVKYHINHILQKLRVRDRTQAVLSALKRGLVHLE
ncbi:MAG TPA: response regulator transcription factor [Coleofasciculaceae cyanobacterium]|jgi:two-component system NarL family response regulator